MGKKYVVRLTEQELSDLISNQLTSSDSGIIGKFIRNLLGGKKETTTLPDKTSTGSSLVQGKDTNFPTLDLNTTEGYNVYKNIADKFISSRSSNILGINGSMLADAAKSSYNRFKQYVPAELALSQLAAEGGFSENPKSRPIRTKNPFNVGNVDSGSNVKHGSVQSGIQSYYDLMSKKYLSGGKTASDLLNNFVNVGGQRYATDRNYESKLSQIAQSIKQKSEPIYASLSKSSDSKTA
jgi:hypothetical protein